MGRYSKGPYVVCRKDDMSIAYKSKSLTDAGDFMGVTQQAAWRQVHDKSVPTGWYVIRRESDYDKDESFEGKHNRPVVAYDAKNGFKESLFSDAREAAWSLGVSRSTVRGAIMGRQAKVCGRWVIAYAR